MGDYWDENERFDTVLTRTGERKIDVIKVVRETIGLGLAEAKDFVEHVPQVLKADISREEAVTLRRRLEAAGALAEIRLTQR